MPTVNLQYGPDDRIDAAAFGVLSGELSDRIEKLLGAKRETIQILPTLLDHRPHGSRVYVEIKARDTEARTEEVLAAFLKEVDEITHRTFGTRCRIRYFRYPGEFLAAIN